MVGSAIVRALEAAGFGNIVTRTSGELDMRNKAAVNAFFANKKGLCVSGRGEGWRHTG
jgi:GDP-L-fucose synthase